MIYEKLKEIRLSAGHSQAQTAELLNMTKQQWSLYETGKRDIPVQKLREFCLLYNISSDYILHLSEEIRLLHQ